MIFRFALVFILVFSFMGGCSSHDIGGAPEPSSNLDADLKVIDDYYGQGTALKAALETNTADARNKFITGRLVAMNLRYLRFVREVTANKQVIDSASDILIISLNLAGAAFGDTATKTALAAISAGVAGSRISIDKNFYYEKTMPALVAAMNAERRKALIPLLRGMKQAIDDYNVAQAVTDLDTYYHAGTLIGAVNAVTVEAGAQEAAANIQIAQLQGLQLARTKASAWIQLNSVPAARSKILQWYNALPANPPYRKSGEGSVILDLAVRSLPREKVADAVIDQSKRQAVLDILVTTVPDKTSELIKLLTGGDMAGLSRVINVEALVNALEPTALSEFMGAHEEILSLP